MVEEKEIATGTAADQARALLRDQRVAEAVRLMRATLMERSGTAEEYGLLSTALAQSGDTAAALHALEEAVVVDPSDAIAHYNRGQLYLQEGRQRDALESFEQALAVRPRYFAAATAAAKLREQGVLSPSAQQWQPPRLSPLAMPPSLRGLAGPSATGAAGGWSSILAEPVSGVERPLPTRPPSLTLLILLIYAGATFSLIGGLYELLTAALSAATGSHAPSAGDPFGMALALGTAVLVTGVSAAQLVIGNYLWYGVAWARSAMTGALALHLIPPLLALCQASDLAATVSGIGRLLLPVAFIAVLHLRSTREYCNY